MRHKLLYILAALAGVMVAAVIAIILLLASDSGSRWLTYYGAGSISNSLTIKRVQGNILAGLELYGIECRVNRNHIFIEQIELGLRPLALLGGKLHLRNLYMEGIKFDAAVDKENLSGDAVQPLQDTFLPPKVTVLLEDGRLERIVLRRGDSRYELDHLNLMGQLDRNGLKVNHLEVAGKDFHVNLTGHSKLLSPYPFQAKLNWNAQLPNGAKVRGKSDISGDVNTIELNHKLLKPFSVESRGKVEVSRVSTDSYRLTFIGDLTGQNLPPTHIQALGEGNLMGLHIEKIVANTLGGEVTVNGHIVLQPVPRWEFTVSGTNLDPGKQWSQWPGNLALNTNIKGEINAGILTNMLNEMRLDGSLFKQPFQMTGNLTSRGEEMTVEALMIRLGENQLRLDGSAAGDLDLRFELDADDPKVIWPGVEGCLRGNGFFKGTRSNPAAEIILKGNKMRYGAYTLQNLEAKIVFDLNNTHQSNGHLRMRNLLVADEAFSDLSFNWTGDLKEHRVSVEVVSASMQGESEVLGACHQNSCEFKVEKASFDLEKYGKWHLLNPVSLNLGYGEIKPFKACWVHEKSSQCVHGSWNDTSGWEIEDGLNAPALIFMGNLLKKVLNKEHLGWKKGAGHE